MITTSTVDALPTGDASADLTRLRDQMREYLHQPTPKASEDGFSLWVDHRARLQAARYTYVVLPNASTGPVQAYAAAPEVEVLRNTAALQAVHSNTLGTTFAIFYRPGGLDYAANKRVTVDAPCLLMLKQTNTGTRIVVADPTQELPGLQVTLDGLARRITLPQGPDAGRNVALSLWPRSFSMRCPNNRNGTFTKFADAPGVLICHSPALVNWWVIGHAYKRLPDWFRFEEGE